MFKFICGRAEYPAFWKLGRVTPVYKRKEVTVAKNYRPITVIPNESATFESVIREEFSAFLEKFTSMSQFGFIKKCGTQDYGACLVMKIINILERRNEAVLISLDVEGAFDRVWHQGLLRNLQMRGLRGRALQLIKNYLKDRYTQVVMGRLKSLCRGIYS